MQRELSVDMMLGNLRSGGSNPPRRWEEGAPSKSANWAPATPAHSVEEWVTQVMRSVSAGYHWVVSGKISCWRSRRGFESALVMRSRDSAEDARERDLTLHSFGPRFVLSSALPFEPPDGTELLDLRATPLHIGDYWIASWFELGRWRARASLDPVAASRLGVSSIRLGRYAA